MNPIRIALVLALAPVTLLAVPAHATTPVGCEADPELKKRVLVKQRPVRTQDGERFAMLRLFAGEAFGGPMDGAGSYAPSYCLDVMLDDEPGGNVRHRGSVVTGGSSFAPFGGRAGTGVLASGRGTNYEGLHLTVTYSATGRGIEARRVMRVTFPEVG